MDATALGEAHEAVRIGVDQLQMNAGPGLQKVALLVRRHAHALRVVGGGGDDPRPEYGLSVYTRAEQAIEYMLDHVRAELRVAGGVVQTPDDEEYEELVKEVARARARVK